MCLQCSPIAAGCVGDIMYCDHRAYCTASPPCTRLAMTPEHKPDRLLVLHAASRTPAEVMSLACRDKHFRKRIVDGLSARTPQFSSGCRSRDAVHIPHTALLGFWLIATARLSTLEQFKIPHVESYMISKRRHERPCRCHESTDNVPSAHALVL